jgi:Na+-transporting methylmalonyl-CoA/oxaloacetate decarboxylase gamma subunit
VQIFLTLFFVAFWIVGVAVVTSMLIILLLRIVVSLERWKNRVPPALRGDKTQPKIQATNTENQQVQPKERDGIPVWMVKGVVLGSVKVKSLTRMCAPVMVRTWN